MSADHPRLWTRRDDLIAKANLQSGSSECSHEASAMRLPET